MTISSVGSQGTPQSAVVGFAENENLEIFFGTANTTRKYKNITENPHVACVIGWSLDEVITVQYEGVATELAGDELISARERCVQKNPFSARFAEHPDQRYFRITPSWIRFSSLKDGDIFEL